METREPLRRRTSLSFAFACLALLSVLALTVAAAPAATAPESLWQRCDGGAEDIACSIPRGIGIDPSNGDVYVDDSGNTTNRIVQFDAWGQFVKTWGWGVLNGAEELQVCTVASECLPGTRGGGAGQIAGPQGIAVDASGNVYVAELANHRVQKFNPEGQFLFMAGGEVNKTKSEEGGSTEAQRNLCVAGSGDVCQAGTQGTGEGQFGQQSVSALIALGTTASNRFYVGDRKRIQVFDTEGHYVEDFPDPESILSSANVQAIAAAPSNGLYLARKELSGSEAIKPNVIRLSSAGKKTGSECEVAKPSALAMAQSPAGVPTGSLYVFDESGTPSARQFNFNCSKELEAPFAGGEVTTSTGIAASVACRESGADAYLSNSSSSASFVRAYGPAPDRASCTKPKFAPDIVAQFATSVGSTEANLKAQIDPRFYADTSYLVQYGTAACIEAQGFEGACAEEEPVPPSLLGAPEVDFPFPTAGVRLTGLSPATEYRYRFVAQSEGGSSAGEGRSLTTFVAPGEGGGGCPNEAFRTGPSAKLPDCRAYEMVSPVDKEGGDIVTQLDLAHRPAERSQSAISGERFSYTSYRAFGDAQSAPYSSQYLASRNPGGWSSQNLSPPRGVGFTSPETVNFANSSYLEFEAFTPDLCSSWLANESSTEAPLAPGAEPFNVNVYRRSNCGGEGSQYETLSKIVGGFAPLQGLSTDGDVAILRDAGRLTQDVAVHASLPESDTLLCRPPTPLKAIARQWLRDGAPIAGATGNTYVVKPGDAGHTIQCRLTATEGGVGSTQVATPAWVIAPYPETAPPVAPKSISAPSASGSLNVGGVGGQTLGCSPGEWEGSPSFEYQWYRNGAALSGNGADTETYTVQAADLLGAAAFQCEVLATNAGGGVAKTSEMLVTTPAPEVPVARPNMAFEKGRVVYAVGGASVHPVCVLPDGVQSDNCSAGSANFGAGLSDGRSDLVTGAISADGRRLFWTDSLVGRGRIYLRENPTTAQSPTSAGECTDPERACTLPVSETVESPAGSSRFWAASADGSRVLFGSGPSNINSPEALYEFEVASGAATLIAHEALGVLGQSADLSRVYFVSREALAEGAQAGEPNLYLRREGLNRFIAVLSSKDALPEAQRLSPVGVQPYLHAARVSSDGESAAFLSTASLTGYDNTDVTRGEADAEIYLYRAGSNKLVCVSCAPSGARPVGHDVSNSRETGESLFAAAKLPNIENELYASHVLSEDGNRVFFESFGPLVLGDTNGVQDVYEWEAPGSGTCTTSSSSYSPQDEGCVSLISSGRSPQDSDLLDVTPDGSDVFFRTGASLLPQDPGSFDVYDARVSGGFPPPPAPAVPCEGEACQGAAPAPDEETPASAAFHGAGNPAPPHGRHQCAKGKRRVVRKGKARCVKRHHRRRHRHHKRKHRRAHRNVRSAR